MRVDFSFILVLKSNYIFFFMFVSPTSFYARGLKPPCDRVELHNCLSHNSNKCNPYADWNKQCLMKQRQAAVCLSTKCELRLLRLNLVRMWVTNRVAFLCNFWHQKLPRPEDLKYIINIFVWNKQNILKALIGLQRHKQSKANPRWWMKPKIEHAVARHIKA